MRLSNLKEVRTISSWKRSSKPFRSGSASRETPQSFAQKRVFWCTHHKAVYGPRSISAISMHIPPSSSDMDSHPLHTRRHCSPGKRDSGISHRASPSCCTPIEMTDCLSLDILHYWSAFLDRESHHDHFEGNIHAQRTDEHWTSWPKSCMSFAHGKAVLSQYAWCDRRDRVRKIRI